MRVGELLFVRGRDFWKKVKSLEGTFIKLSVLTQRRNVSKRLETHKVTQSLGDEVTTVFHDFFTNLYTCDLNVDHDVQDVFLKLNI